MSSSQEAPQEQPEQHRRCSRYWKWLLLSYESDLYKRTIGPALVMTLLRRFFARFGRRPAAIFPSAAWRRPGRSQPCAFRSSRASNRLPSAPAPARGLEIHRRRRANPKRHLLVQCDFFPNAAVHSRRYNAGPRGSRYYKHFGNGGVLRRSWFNYLTGRR